MSWPFLDIARAELGLGDEQVAWMRAANIRSFDQLHATLRASPSLETLPRFGRAGLIERIQNSGPPKHLLSERYRGMLDAPAPDFPVMPLRLALVIGQGAVQDWPGTGRPVLLGPGDPPVVSLLDGLEESWPVRNQSPHEAACVGFATAAAMERITLRRGQAAPGALSALFVYQRIPVRFPKDPFVLVQKGPRLDGPTRLSEAFEILRSEGICRRAVWPDTTPANARPGVAEVLQAAGGRMPAAEYWDLDPERFIRPSGVARVILDLLVQGRPVAVSMPEYHDPGPPAGVTNWRTGDAWQTGIVGVRAPGWVMAPSGHAVCILGFVSDPTEALGGWFIFRNSWGLVWGAGAPDANAPVEVPKPGYGALAASHVEEAV